MRLRPLRQPEDRGRLGGALGRAGPVVPAFDQPAPRLLDPAGGLSRAQRIDDPRRRTGSLGRSAGRIQIEGLLAIYDIPRISQVQLIYRARLLDEGVAAGPESLEVRLFGWDEIPWDDLAFPSVRWALHHEKEALVTGDLTTRCSPPDPTMGSGE